MDPPTSEVPKLPDMVMCGDHPSFTKTELNAKDARSEEEKLKDKPPTPYNRLTPTPSRTERALSEHGLRALAARRRVRSLETVARDHDPRAPANRALVQAALGSFRWPPYLVCVWVAVLVLTHALHALVALLDRALPAVRSLCQYFRAWTTASWKAERELSRRLYPASLALATAALYALWAALGALNAAATWALEPLCEDDELPLKLTNYDDGASKTDNSVKCKLSN